MNAAVEFLLNTDSIRKAMTELAREAVAIHIMAAWATRGSGLESLSVGRAGHKKAIIGTSFAVTEPDALLELLQMGYDLRVVDRRPKGGTFHPKVYIFEHVDGDSTVLVGSANLTHSAFTRNTEVMVRTKLGPRSVRSVRDLFERTWDSSREMTDEWFDKYRATYSAAASVRSREIAKAERGDSEHSKRSVALVSISQLQGLITYQWTQYLRAIEDKRGMGRSGLAGADNSYLRTLKIARPLLRSGLAVAEQMDLKKVMGKADNCGWFGVMSLMRGKAGAIYQDRALRKCVDRYLQPLWDVSEDDEVLEEGRRAFIGLEKIDGFGSGFITRMLTLARPDRFYSVNNGSRDGLASLFGVPKARLATWDGYSQGLEIVYKTPWFQSAPPIYKNMRQLWDARVALIDAYVYRPPK